jgi:hypothetical protein
MTNFDRQQRERIAEYDYKVRQEAESQRIKKTARNINLTKRQRIQQTTNDYGTLTGALLNGSLTKWFFVMFMLVGVIALFDTNPDLHWLDISEVDGLQIIEIKDDAYDIDIQAYETLGTRMMSNFMGITIIFEQASTVLRSISSTIENVGSFFGGDNWFSDGVSWVWQRWEPLLIWNWEIWGN